MICCCCCLLYNSHGKAERNVAQHPFGTQLSRSRRMNRLWWAVYAAGEASLRQIPLVRFQLSLSSSTNAKNIGLRQIGGAMESKRGTRSCFCKVRSFNKQQLHAKDYTTTATLTLSYCEFICLQQRLASKMITCTQHLTTNCKTERLMN